MNGRNIEKPDGKVLKLSISGTVALAVIVLVAMPSCSQFEKGPAQHPNILFILADDLGYGEQFIPAEKYSMLDDHTPFLAAGIPAVDVIDFDYPYWHTTEDTDEKVSAASLKAVGDTISNWLVNYR